MADMNVSAFEDASIGYFILKTTTIQKINIKTTQNQQKINILRQEDIPSYQPEESF